MICLKIIAKQEFVMIRFTSKISFEHSVKLPIITLSIVMVFLLLMASCSSNHVSDYSSERIGVSEESLETSASEQIESSVSTATEDIDQADIPETGDRSDNHKEPIPSESEKESPAAPIKMIKGTESAIKISDNKEMEALLDEILAITGDMTINMGVYYYNLVNGDMISINGTRQFRSASTAKIFVVMAMYDSIEKGKLELDQVVYYEDSDYEGGAGIMQNMDLTQGYELEKLAEYAIVHSDNIAFQMIRRITGWDNCYDYYESIIGHPTDRVTTHMSAEDAGKLLQFAYESDDPNMRTMLDLMRSTDFEQAIPKHLPENTVSNKIGLYEANFHDAAIIHDSDEPYILTIYTEFIEDYYKVDPEAFLAEISSKIYSVR